MKLKILLPLLSLILICSCSVDYDPDCDYVPPTTFEIIRNDNGKYLIIDNSDERAEHAIFPQGMNIPPVNIFESETFDDSCSAKGFLKTGLGKFNKNK